MTHSFIYSEFWHDVYTYIHIILREIVLYLEPSAFPTHLKVVLQTRNTVTLQWKRLECYEENGPIVGYQYRIYSDLIHQHYQEGIVDGGTNRIRLLFGNTRKKAFSVAAINEAGVGQHSPLLVLDSPIVGTYSYTLYRHTFV